MGLKKDLSVVADSEMTSPRSSTSSPAPINRAARTYGRRRDPDVSFTSEQDSKDSIYRTGPPDLSDEVPPSEMSRMMDSDSDTEDENMLPNSLLQPKFTFGWREKLRRIDDEDDLSGHAELKGIDPSVSFSPEQVALQSPSHVATDINSPVKAKDASALKNTRFKDAVVGSLLSVPSPSYSRNSGVSSPPRGSRSRTRPSKNVIISGDEMGQESDRDSRPSSPTTSPSHLIATPKSQLTSSPPTSHGDHASAASTSSSTSKGKGKTWARNAVVPLRLDSHRPESFDNLELAPHRRSLDHKEMKRRIKAPTKKELQETARERARIAAERTVSIPKVAKSEDRSLAGFFAKIAKQQGHVQSDVLRPSFVEPPPGQHLSSPIDSFSSSQPQPHEHGFASRSAAARQTVTSSRQSPSPQRPTPVDAQLVADNNSDCDEHPSADSLLDSPKTKKQLEATKRQSLATLKQHLARMQNLKPKSISEDEDDELEVLPRTKIEEQRDSRQTKQLSKGYKMLLANAQITVKPLDPRKLTKQEFDHFQEDILTHGVSDPRILTTVMRQRAERESMDIVKQKEEEFVRLGGVVKKENVLMDKLQGHQIILEYARKGMESWSRKDNGSETTGTDDEGEDEDDPDWVLETRGSMGPQEGDQDGGLDPEELVGKEIGDERIMDQDIELTRKSSQSDDDLVFKVKAKKRPLGRIIDSDDSDSGEYGGATFSKPTKPLYATSSSDDRTEDENDKENNTRLMFDRSEDKENKAVVRHEASGGIRGPVGSLRSVFDDASDLDRESSVSPPHVLAFDLEAGEVPGDKGEPPLAVKGDSVDSSQRLKHSPPTCNSPYSENALGHTLTTPASTLNFAPVFGGGDVREEKPTFGGFSQFSQEGLGFGAPTRLRPGFADLFNPETQKEGFRREESLRLTQDVTLQPAFQVDEKLLRKADAIFEKEQEYLVEVAGKKFTRETELYVNEVGLLTQTRPSRSERTPGSPPFILSPTQASFRDQDLSLTQTQLRSSITLQSQSRPPLRTISLSSVQLSPGASPKCRLRKREETVTPQASPVRSSALSVILSTSPPLQRLNAFDILGKRFPRHESRKSINNSPGKDARSMKMIREYVMDEAEESDEDQAIGFGIVRKRDKEDDEDGGDMDASLPDLVDDQKMDAETEGIEKVREKHQELLEKDDEEVTKLHERVVQGELRKKRKGQFGLDDSDEEDEEDDRTRKIRRKMKERRERGDIQALADNEKTAAFANAYHAGVHDDEVIELRPLDIERDLRTGEGDDGDDILTSDDQDEQGDLEDQGQEGKGEKFVTYKDIQTAVRRMREYPQEEVETRDFGDVSWIEEQPADADEMDLDVPVITNEEKTGSTTTAKSTPVGEWHLIGMGGIRRKENERDLERSRAWARSESRNATGTTGRVVGGIAVTGHGSSRAKRGGGSLRPKALASTSATSSISSIGGKKPLKSSVLTNLSKRKDQFK